mgnify:FL=1
MPAPVAERPVLRPCTVCGSMVPSSQVTYDDVFGFVCHECDIPQDVA